MAFHEIKIPHPISGEDLINALHPDRLDYRKTGNNSVN